MKPTPLEFIALVGQERMTHEARGYGAEHDEREGIGHLLHWAMEYASKGEHVKAMSLVMAAMDVESKRTPRTVKAVEDADSLTDAYVEHVNESPTPYLHIRDIAGRPWLVWESEAGDMLATSWPDEDDATPGASRALDIESLGYPVTVLNEGGA